VENDYRFIINIKIFLSRVVCSCMVWKKCGAALVRWFWSEMLVVALPAYPQNGTQSFKSNIGSPCWLLPAFEDGPQQIRVLVIDGLARSRNKLENQEHQQRTRTTITNTQKRE